MKRLSLFFFFGLLGFYLQAQGVSDAVRLSYLEPGGSARYLGAGGAFSALGADYAVLSTNPAGLAMFRTDELVLTPSLRFANTKANLSGNESYEDQKSNFNFNSLGFIFNTEPRSSKWTTFNFGIGMNRQQNFNRSIYYEGTGQGSIMNNWFDSAVQSINNGASETELDPFGAQMGYDGNAIYYQDGELSYDFISNPNANISRNQGLISSGSINEMVFSFAGNYDERLMVGATIGVPFVNYRLDGTYEESDPTNAVDYFDRLSYTEYLRTQGVGVNAKFGMILRITQALRIGAAFHTPTFMGLTDNYSNTFSYTYTDGNGSFTNTSTSPDGTSDYKLRTPWRASVGGALLTGRMGFISADVEWVDYSAARYNFTADVSNAENERFERETNNDIQHQLKTTNNIRFGGELVLDIFRLRAGYNLLGKPYEGDNGYNGAISFGAGIRTEAFYLDFGYRRSKTEGSVSPYSGAPETSLVSHYNDYLMTLGFKF